MAITLASSASLEVVGEMTHAAVSSWPGAWTGVDVAIVDGTDIRRADDQFPGVGVVRHIRALSADTLILVVTGFYFEDALRWRMKEAGAHFFYHRTELAEDSALLRAVIHPEQTRRGVPDITDSGGALLQGVGRGVHLNAAVDFATNHNLAAYVDQRPDPRSRRWLRLRSDFTEAARAVPINADGTPPDRTQDTVSWDQIGRIHRWATRVANPWGD